MRSFKRLKKKELIELVERYYESLYGPEWVREAWNKAEKDFGLLDTETLIKLARYELDHGNFEDAKDVLAELQRRNPKIRVRDELTEALGIVNRIYEELRKMERGVSE